MTSFDQWGDLRVMKGLKIGPMRHSSLRGAALGGLIAACLGANPAIARADCDVPDNGIPEETLLSRLGPNWASLGGLRPSLAKSRHRHRRQLYRGGARQSFGWA